MSSNNNPHLSKVADPVVSVGEVDRQVDAVDGVEPKNVSPVGQADGRVRGEGVSERRGVESQEHGVVVDQSVDASGVSGD